MIFMLVALDVFVCLVLFYMLCLTVYLSGQNCSSIFVDAFLTCLKVHFVCSIFVEIIHEVLLIVYYARNKMSSWTAMLMICFSIKKSKSLLSTCISHCHWVILCYIRNSCQTGKCSSNFQYDCYFVSNVFFLFSVASGSAVNSQWHKPHASVFRNKAFQREHLLGRIVLLLFYFDF